MCMQFEIKALKHAKKHHYDPLNTYNAEGRLITHLHHSRDTISVLRGRECFQGWLRINKGPPFHPPTYFHSPLPSFIVYLTIQSPPFPLEVDLFQIDRTVWNWVHSWCKAVVSVVNNMNVCHSAWANRLMDDGNVNSSVFIRVWLF